MEYKSNITYGSLAECGRIKCTIGGTELTFESPSAFSIYLKRLINPARKADDGWKTVKFEGKVRPCFCAGNGLGDGLALCSVRSIVLVLHGLSINMLRG